MQGEFQQFEANDSWHRVIQNLDTNANYATRKHTQQAGENYMEDNRYCNILPFDAHRVRLDTEDYDYINASLVKVLVANREYILSQGPLKSTAGRFWMMVWQKNCGGVVMLTKLRDGMMVICDRYYPTEDDKQMKFEEGFTLCLSSSDNSNDGYIIRTLLLHNIKLNQTRTILHYQFISWPDYGVPDGTTQFLSFLRHVRASGILIQQDGHGPAVVHCSAGVGRSGTFCLVDSALVMVEEKKQSLEDINLRRVLLDMRMYREYLIQTPEQLRFAYLSILEACKVKSGAEES